MSDEWTDRLSEYIDGELSPADAAALEAHLQRCAACHMTLAELRRVVSRARALEDSPPATDLWPGIATRIGARPRAAGRRWTFSLPQLMAAGIALVALSGGSVWLLSQRTTAPAPSGPTATPAAATTTPLAIYRSYDSAIADLERMLRQDRGALDTATVRIITQNLATIDSAIAQAQRAVAADPGSVYLNNHLAQTMRRKLDVLRWATTLAGSAS